MQGELSALSDDSSEDEGHGEHEHVGIDGRDVLGVEECGVVEAVELAEQSPAMRQTSPRRVTRNAFFAAEAALAEAASPSGCLKDQNPISR